MEELARGFFSIGSLVQIGGILFILAYVVSQLRMGKFKGDSELVKELIDRVNGKEIIIKDLNAEILKLRELLKTESEVKEHTIEEAKKYKKMLENRNPELINILRADHDILLQVRKIEEQIVSDLEGGVK